MSCLDGYQIASHATVKILMTAEPKSDYDTINVRHANGARINIVGDCDGKACAIQFKPNVSGVVVSGNHSLGQFSNFNLVGAGDSDGSVGVYANDNSYVELNTDPASQ